MGGPEELEQAADRLRARARSGRQKADALATHLDSLVTTAGDTAVWKGSYPTQAVHGLTTDQQGLGRAATLLREDAAAWDRRAGELDDHAADMRAAAKKKAADEKAGSGTPR